MAVYGDKMRLVWKDFPLTRFTRSARPAAEAAGAQPDQGKFWEYHDKLFASQLALQPEFLKKYAADTGLDTAKFNQCLEYLKYEARVQEALGAGGQPRHHFDADGVHKQPDDQRRPADRGIRNGDR